MAGDLGPRHREAHVREQATLAALADVPLGVLVGLGGRRADDVDAELRRRGARVPATVTHRILPSHRDAMKAIRIHEDGGPEVLRYEDAPDPEPGPGRGPRRAARGLAEPPRPLGPARDGRPCPSRASSEPTAPASPTASACVDQPRHRARRQDHGHRRAHGRHACRVDRRAVVERLPDPRRHELRGGRRLPARLRDRLPDARHERRAARGRVGARLGHRRRRRDRGELDRTGTRRADDRHLLERREARPGRGRREGEPRRARTWSRP